MLFRSCIESSLTLGSRDSRYIDVGTPYHPGDAHHWALDAGWKRLIHLDVGCDVVKDDNDKLVLEAKVAPRDIAFIAPNQNAMVKFTAYDFSIYGGLDAKVENISPDTVIDEKGNAFYVVRVRTNRPDFGAKLPVMPGMTAEVDILTGQKTVLSYLLKPILKAKHYALRER